MLVNATPQVVPTASVDTGATAVRGFSNEVRSDVPPIQQGDGVRYTRGRPSDNETYSGMYSARKRGEAMAGVAPSATTSVGTDETEGKTAIPNQNQDVEAAGSDSNETAAPAASTASTLSLSPEDQAMVEQLKRRDREVKLHEQAHQSTGGQYTGSASFEYQRGPDGKRYAVGGEVSVDIGVADDPQATVQKARQIRAAALAPAQPSAQDRRVAAAAERMIASAQLQIRQDEAAAAKAELEQRNSEAAAEAKAKAEANAEAQAEARAEPDQKAKSRDKPVDTEKVATVTASVKSEKPTRPKAEADEGDSSENKSEKSQASPQKEKMTAREALEKVLLSGQSISSQANAAGYVSPAAPNGESGLLNLVI